MDLLILGVDGVDPEYLARARERYELENWERLFEESFYTELPSTIPAVTIPAWPCMFTGYDPGKFGAYHLVQLDLESMEGVSAKSSSFRGDFFWDRISKTAGLHYVPGTYPAYPVNGYMRGGFPSPGFDFYPEELRDEFESLEKYRPGAKTTSKGKIKAEMENYRQERKIFEKFVEKDPDVLVSVIKMTDDVSHYAESEEQLLESYREADSDIGRALELADEHDADLIVVSDHGFNEYHSKFNALKFLVENGYTELESGGETSLVNRIAAPFLDSPLKKYMKYAHDLVKNLTGKSVAGRGGVFESMVEDSEMFLYFNSDRDFGLKINPDLDEERKEELKNEIKHDLEALERNGEPVVEKVWIDPYTENEDNPEIVVRMAEGYLAAASKSEPLFVNTKTFAHDDTGVFFARGDRIETDAEADMDIYDVAPLVYALLDEPVPDDLKGEVPEIIDVEPEYRSMDADIEV